VITYMAWAVGTREEIIAELEAAITPGRSEKRKAGLREAIDALRAGASTVYNKPTRYVVKGEAHLIADQIITLLDDPKGLA
jgi:hypothetical protein